MTNKETKVINFLGAPCTRKSTYAAYLFHKMKSRGLSCELVPEVAKEKVWEEDYIALSDQISILGEQYHRIFRLLGKVDYVVVDAPILLQIFYDSSVAHKEFSELVLKLHKSMTTVNYVLAESGETAFLKEGRIEEDFTHDEFYSWLYDVLSKNSIPVTVISSEEDLDYLFDGLTGRS